MAKVEVEQETAGQSPSSSQAELVVGLPGLVDVAQVKATAAQWASSGHHIAVVFPCVPGMSEGREKLGEAGDVWLVAREVTAVAAATAPWLGQPVVYSALLAEAESLGAGACVILNPDLAGFTPPAVDALLRPIREDQCDLAMPLYRAGPFDGLLNQAILAPVTRALYGKRVRYPLAQDFAVSAGFLPGLRQGMSTPAAGQGLLWPATEAVLRDKKVCQVALPVHHDYPNYGHGPADTVAADRHAAVCGHGSSCELCRSGCAGSHSVTEIRWGRARGRRTRTASYTPIRDPMVEAFQLGHATCRSSGPSAAAREPARVEEAEPAAAGEFPDVGCALGAYRYILRSPIGCARSAAAICLARWRRSIWAGWLAGAGD